MVFSIFLFSVVSAQEIATDEDIKLAGILPDSILYGLELVLERITELFDKNAKLSHAMERLAEVKVMIDKNKINEAERARRSFDVTYSRIENTSQIEEHKRLLDNLGEKISQVASVRNNLTIEDREEIFDLVERHKENVLEETENIKEIRTQGLSVASRGGR